MGNARLRPEDLGALVLGERPGAVRISVWAKPRASRSAVAGVREGALEVQVAAPPVDGEANAELVRSMAKWLGVPARCVAVVGGESGRRKVLEVSGVDAAVVRARLALL